MPLTLLKVEIKTQKTVKGTRILFGETAKKKSDIITTLRGLAVGFGFQEMYLPVVQFQETFAGKVGSENNNMMYNFMEKEVADAELEPEFLFTDQGNRKLCLAPEYTAVVQDLASTTFKMQTNVKIFYIVECFRGEKPQAGRYRQFTQFGMEVLNPKKDFDWVKELGYLAMVLIEANVPRSETISLNNNVTRGLDYYKEGKGFEVSLPSLGAQKQVCGGGEYEGGVGFALGVDRLLIVNNPE